MTPVAPRPIGTSIEAQAVCANGKYCEAVIQATVGSSVLLLMDDVKENPEHL